MNKIIQIMTGHLSSLYINGHVLYALTEDGTVYSFDEKENKWIPLPKINE